MYFVQLRIAPQNPKTPKEMSVNFFNLKWKANPHFKKATKS